MSLSFDKDIKNRFLLLISRLNLKELKFLYTIAIYIYSLFIKVLSPFYKKAYWFNEGRKGLLNKMEGEVKSDLPILWVHCSSVGEFEQARPIVEKIRERGDKIKILLTFFSPSGYNLRRDYQYVDWVYYLPLDTLRNAERFLDIVRPEKVIFIKYDYWYYFLSQLKKRNIPTYLVSAVFRKEQIFFKWYGRFYKKILYNFTKLFVQDLSSLELLNSIGIHEVMVCGDTRFDRVYEIAKNNYEENIIVKTFVDGIFTWVAGSTWEKDEIMISAAFRKLPKSKLIIAPHEVEESRISDVKRRFEKSKVVKYTDYLKYGDNIPESAQKRLVAAEVLIIDCIGILSSLYKYGKFAYIGGGFGTGIHNILEAAVYGCPIIFGPKYKEFREAVILVEAGGANSFSKVKTMVEDLTRLISNEELYSESSHTCQLFVEDNLGAADTILANI